MFDGQEESSIVDIEEHESVAIDKLLQATFGLWNALLTVNGIMLSVFSAVYAITPQGSGVTVRILIGACVVSSCLLVFNHVAVKVTYHRIGEVVTGWSRPLTETKRQRDISHAEWLHCAVGVSEKVCLALFVIEVILAAVFTYTLPGRG